MPPKTSIIIVSYNNYDETTGPCLESLFDDESNSEFEIIVVDNNSKDNTVEMLKKKALKHTNLSLILNIENRGFAGGNNDGVRRAKGDIVVLLNSDTVVPPNAIGKLSSLLDSNQTWAMLAPVTNEAGNEQKIYSEASDFKKIIEDGHSWCRHSNEDCFESPRLDFCCVAIKKNIYTQLGGLDESFGLGYYEDTDFSLKVLKKGYKIMITEGVFIYHKAGKSFSSHAQRRVHNLMKANRKLLKAKHPEGFQLYHIRECNFSILREYVKLQEENKLNRDICKNIYYRFMRRYMMAKSFYPTNPVKKIKYKMALNSVIKKFRKCNGEFV
ncbi:MAG: glycosyltransferase family 2 protein [Desulfobacter sp.]|nr:MAG: glycosyltransferase family 2 protein [Desulfobacter sp.]